MFGSGPVSTTIGSGGAHRPRQDVDVIRELRRVLEGKSGGAFTITRSDQTGDLDDLTLAP